MKIEQFYLKICFLIGCVTERGKSVWVLDLCPGGFENMFIKAENSEPKEGLGVEDVTGMSLGSALLWLP